MEYITISDGKITGHYCGETLPPGAIIVNDFNGCPGDPVEFYTHTWQRKSDIELIREGLIPIPLGYKLDGDNLTEMSLLEKIQSGIEELPIGYNARNYASGKKITYKDGLMAIVALIKYKFTD